ncbi:MAG: glycosyltransferase [Gemmatimonadales bacterium]
MQVTQIERCWRASRPDLVVSLIPHFNRARHEATRRLRPQVPFVTILTDLSDYPPHFWIEGGQDQYVVCGTPRAREQALAAGLPAEREFETSGMILNRGFYEPVEQAPPPAHAALGLDPAVPTALLMFGGAGSAVMPAIAQRLDASGLTVQLIAVCGRNEGLEASMRALSHRLPMHVTGFTGDVARLMRLSDFFIGKPGPGSISEAVAMGLPVIVECNRRTLPQERYNATWVEERGFGVTIRDFRRDIVGAVGVMLDPVRRAQFGERVKAYRNRAVFEIMGILETILSV